MLVKKTLIKLLIGLPIVVAIWSFSLEINTTLSLQKEKQILWTIKPLEVYTAGEVIVFKSSEIVSGEINDKVLLYLSSSYGSTVVFSEAIDGQLLFKVPPELSKKSGEVYWELLNTNKDKLDAGSFHIQPNQRMAPIVESYLGPETIVAGGLDYSMMVVLATDNHDNLVPNQTPVNLKTHFGNSGESYGKTTQDRITWERIFSPTKSGRMLVSGTSNLASTVEKTLNIIPNNATNFKISENLVHPYADGNQIAVFTTSEIKDEFNNTISDGTLVTFTAVTSQGEKMQVAGTTINGIASGQFLHPKKPTLWKVEGFVMGLAKSEPLEVSFKSVVEDLNVNFSPNNRSISVGPITSYMGQLIPDGAEIMVTIEPCDQTYLLTSRNGIAVFELNPTLCPNGPKTIQIETMGLSRNFEKTLH